MDTDGKTDGTAQVVSIVEATDIAVMNQDMIQYIMSNVTGVELRSAARNLGRAIGRFEGGKYAR